MEDLTEYFVARIVQCTSCCSVPRPVGTFPYRWLCSLQVQVRSHQLPSSSRFLPTAVTKLLVSGATASKLIHSVIFPAIDDKQLRTEPLLPNTPNRTSSFKLHYTLNTLNCSLYYNPNPFWRAMPWMLIKLSSKFTAGRLTKPSGTFM